jgi:hypothetical protein
MSSSPNIIHENAYAIFIRADPGYLTDGQFVVVDRWQPSKEGVKKVSRVAVVDAYVAGTVGIPGDIKGWDGSVDYLLVWLPDDPETQTDSHRIEIGKPTYY